MSDPKEQKLIEARDEADRKWAEARREWVEAKRGEWVEAHREWVDADRNCGAAIRKLRDYCAQSPTGRKGGVMTKALAIVGLGILKPIKPCDD